MSAPWKGWVASSVANGLKRWDYIAVSRDAMDEKLGAHAVARGIEPRPVIVCPIDDESLPHPGDGRDWETGWNKRVEIVTVPWVTGDGTTLVAAKDGGGTYHSIYRVDDLRERKPEPPHKPWCHKSCGCGFPPYECTCERRSGEERRRGERRGADFGPLERINRPAASPDAKTRRKDQRSGTDRRSQ